MKLFKNRTFLLVTALALSLVIGLSATFAWVTSKASKDNVFAGEDFSGANGLVVVEPEEEFEFNIGADTDKHVSIGNTGKTGMLARVTFDEMIKLLAKEAASNTAYIDYLASSTPTGKQQRMPFEASVTGWEAMTTANGYSFTPALPAGVEVYKSGTTYQARYEYETGKYQLVKFDGVLNTATKAFTGVSLQYAYYYEGTAAYASWNGEKNWADWESETYMATTKPALADVKKSIVDPTEITFNYGTSINFTTPTANTWYYNPADGYFYWIGVIPSGGFTDDLMTSVNLSGSADAGAWMKYEYTLVVTVEGLQATKEALTDTTATGTAAGWQLSDATLIAALEAAIDAAG